MNLSSFYKGKKVWITGHTGFKGSWLCALLSHLGADVCGYALQPPTDPSLYETAAIGGTVQSIMGDIRDRDFLKESFSRFSPEIVLHLAAQPLVRDSYANPAYTYETNVMGTVNLLEAIRTCESVRSFVNVTTDKVYQNNEWDWGYREIDRLNGYDPYSNSKSCSELVTDAYKKSFFSEKKEMGISTARAGNVIGGGDFAADRIVPDCVRAASRGENIFLRNPYSTRPYQHVLEPVFAYLLIAKMQYEQPAKYQGSYNIGPNDTDCITTGELATIFCEAWGNLKWETINEAGAVHEANFLKLDCSKIKNLMGIAPKWNIQQAVEKTVEWTRCYLAGGDVYAMMQNQIQEYGKGF